jgi:hypothetical protein
MKIEIPITLTQKVVTPEAKINVVNLVQDSIIHPTFQIVCKKHMTKIRKPIRHASLDQPTFTQYITAQYTFIHPVTNKRSYYTPPLPNVIGIKRHDTDTILCSVEPVLRNEMTYVAAARQGRNTHNLSIVPGTISKWVNQMDVDEKAFNELQQQVIDRCSGHLSIDEVYDDEGTIITTDPVNDTILHISTHAEPITNEIIESHLQEIKDMGIQPESFTKDGSPLYVNTIHRIFGLWILLQTCLFHLIKSCIKEYCGWMKAIRDEIEIPKMKRGRKKKGDSNIPDGNPYKKLKQRLFRLRYAILRLHVSKEERKDLREVFQDFPDLKKVRGCFLLLKRVLQSPTLEEGEKRYHSFINNPMIQTYLPDVIKKLSLPYSRGELFTYLQYGKAIHKKIRTTNHTERTNRKFRKKQKTHYRIRKYENKIKMLRFMQYFHNFQAIYGKKLDFVIALFILYFYRQRVGICLKKGKEISKI